VTHAVVEVRVGSVTGPVWRLKSVVAVGGARGQALLPERAPTRPITLPATFTVKAGDRRGRLDVVVDALDQEGRVAGRGAGSVDLVAQDGVRLEVLLGLSCDNDETCQDGRFCNGMERCTAGVCQGGQESCPPSAVACVQVGCVEEARRCAVTADHTLCAPFTNAEGEREPAYCDAVLGCTRGTPCGGEEECQDGFLCNGAERCVGGRCIGGVPPAVDDGQDCTVDVCVEGEGRRHFPVADGNHCTQVEHGICLGGVCVTPRCGDGVLDRGEACDDANDNPNDGCDRCQRTAWVATVVAGLGPSGGVPTRQALRMPSGVAVDRSGVVHVADAGGQRIWRWDPRSGLSTLVAGLGGASEACTPEAIGTRASLGTPKGLAMDLDGSLVVADDYQGCTYRLTRGGRKEPLGTNVSIPMGVTVSARREVYCSDAGRNVVLRDGIVVAGNGVAGYAGDNGPATSARLNGPRGVAVDREGNLFIADMDNHRVRRVGPDGVIRTVVGNGVAGGGGDNGPAGSAQVNSPYGIALDGLGRTWLTEADGARVRMVDEDGVIHTVAGTGVQGGSGDVADARTADLGEPTFLAVAANGDVFFSERANHRVRHLHADGSLTTAVGATDLVSPYVLREPEPALSRNLGDVSGLAADAAGAFYLSQYYFQVVERVSPAGQAVRVVGSGREGVCGRVVPSQPALEADLCHPTALAVTSSGELLVSDTDNHVVRRLRTDGTLVVVAGTGQAGSGGDGGDATRAQLSFPQGLAVLPDGSVLVADHGNHRVRRVGPDGVISTVAGTGEPASTGDGGLATAAALHGPDGLAASPGDGFYVTERMGNRVRWVRGGGTVQTVAGTGARGFSGDNGPATSALLDGPRAVWPAPGGGFWVADASNHRVRRVDASGTITTVAGTGDAGSGVDFHLARLTPLHRPSSLATDVSGSLLIGEAGGALVRRVVGNQLAVVAGHLRPGDNTVRLASLHGPSELVALDASRWLWVDDKWGMVRVMDQERDTVSTAVGQFLGMPLSSVTTEAARVDMWTGEERPVRSVAYSREDGWLWLGRGPRILRVEIPDVDDPRTWSVRFYAGADGPDFRDGILSRARFGGSLEGLAWDATGRRLLVADGDNHCVRAVQVDWEVVETVAGVPGVYGVSLDDTPAREALLGQPTAVTPARDGSLYVASRAEGYVWRVGLDGVVRHVLGDGTANSSGQGGPAWLGGVNQPSQMAVDGWGNLWVTSSDAIRLVVAGSDGVAEGSGTLLTAYGGPPRDRFPASHLAGVAGLALAPDGASVLFTDEVLNLVVRLDRQAAVP
jgi:cysteine-rich repeat protein